MTKQELEKAIENGESVWVVDKDLEKVIPYNANRIIVNNFNADALGYNFEDLYKTKAEAEHYLHHANVERVEKLPFLTWEEFLEKKAIHFIDNKGIDFVLCITDNKIKLKVFFMVCKTWDLTEANFYKAYDECVRLFKGE